MENFKEEQMFIIEKHSRCRNVSHPDCAVLEQLPTVVLSQDLLLVRTTGLKRP